MTLTARIAPPTTSTCFVSQIIRPTVDVQFPEEHPPQISFAQQLDLAWRVGAGTDGTAVEDEPAMRGVEQAIGTLTLEVQQHLGNNVVRAVAMGPTDGLRRGIAVRDTGAPISVPVGPPTLGRLFNV